MMALALEELGLICTLLVIIFGAFLRLFLVNNGVKNLFFLPYPAGLLLLGILMGGISFSNEQLNNLALILEQVNSIPGLNMFLPAYVFKTVFLLDWQDFLKCWKQVITLSVVGFLGMAIMSGAAMAVLCNVTSINFIRIVLYGGVIGLTDPGELFNGYSQLRQLRTLLQAEALVSLVLTMIIYTQHEIQYSRTIETNLPGPDPIIAIAMNIVLAMLGKIFQQFLNYDKCDFYTFICVSIAAGYLLFYITEIFFSYGIVSLIVFSIIICPFRRGHDKEKDEALTKFWIVIQLVANFLVCVYAGILFIRAFVALEMWESLWKIISLYLVVLFARSLTILVLFPLLANLGFRLCWRRAVVLIWGGVRCTISLGLAYGILETENRKKFQTYGVGMILLNQIINGSTVRALILGLGLLAPAQVSSIDKVLWHLEEEKAIVAQMLHTNILFADAQWGTVEETTLLKRTRFSRHHSLGIDEELLGVRYRQCTECRKLVPERLSSTELQDLEIVARKKILKAQKVSYTRQHAQELLSTEAYEILCSAVENAFLLPLPVIQISDLKRYWTLGGLQAKVYSCLVRFFPDPALSTTSYEKHWFLTLALGVHWEWFVMIMVVLHAVSVLLDLCVPGHEDTYISHALTTSFLFLTFLQLLVKMSVMKCKLNSLTWLALDFVAIIVCLFHFILLLQSPQSTHSTVFICLSVLRLIRLMRLLRLVLLIRKTLPCVSMWLNRLISQRLLLGYDIGKGFILGNEETLKLLRHLVHSPDAMLTLQVELEMDRLSVFREIELLQRYWPIPVTSLKTRQCALSLVRRMQMRSVELSSAGLLDEEEENLLLKELVDLRRRLQIQLRSVIPRSGQEVLAQVPWLRSCPDLVRILSDQAIPWRLSPGKMVVSVGDVPEGLLLVCSGLLRSHYVPNGGRVQQLHDVGALPNVDLLRHLNYSEPQVEFAWEGAMLGEIGVLTGRSCDVSILCETSVLLWHISMKALQPVLSQLEISMWKTVATRIASMLLSVTAGFETWTQERIRTRLETCLLPDLSDAVSLDTGGIVQCLFLIEGMISDAESGALYTAPCIIQNVGPRLLLPSPGASRFPEGVPLTRLLVLPSRDVDGIRVSRSENGRATLVPDITWCPLHDPSVLLPESQ